MQTKDFYITLDMMRTLPFRPFEVVEGDTGNILHVTLLNNGDAMDLSGCDIHVAFASSSGFAMQDQTSGIEKTAQTGTFDITLLPTAYGAGNVSADVQIYSGESNKILVTSTRFDFRCRKSLISGDIIRANTAYPPLIEAARVANEAAATALSAAERINTDIGEMNVQADWNEADTAQDAFIRNKPTLPSAPGDVGAAPASHAAQHQQIALCNGIVEGLNQEGTQRFIAAGDARVIDPGLVLEPLLDDLRTHATAKTIQAPFRVGPRKICPRLQSLGLGRTRNQLMPQYHRRLLALLLVTRTHAFAFMVSHERQIDHAGECTLVKFNRRAGVHHRPVVDEQIAQVGYVMSHHETSTAYVCRSTNWPIG